MKGTPRQGKVGRGHRGRGQNEGDPKEGTGGKANGGDKVETKYLPIFLFRISIIVTLLSTIFSASEYCKVSHVGEQTVALLPYFLVYPGPVALPPPLPWSCCLTATSIMALLHYFHLYHGPADLRYFHLYRAPVCLLYTTLLPLCNLISMLL